ncbi:heterokaryon incompatibility protein-domain-containing protein [Aspergillus stella-maris]|uniref:heterokaryon incompatibility protein-domain-containing protein n=1 Tax=Aspergillus stella-maris TaxID=1810926 RepID=UPI003CCCD44B
MRLLDATTFELVEFPPSQLPPYAILSHTWETGEVLFEDLIHGVALSKPGFEKLRRAATQAIQDGLSYIWIDSCCVNKDSSAELSESINSMFAWYRNAQTCYVYLPDVGSVKDLSSCRWFTRGWALQELIAPADVLFLSRNWMTLGSKTDLRELISNITGIDIDYSCGYWDLESASIAQRMSWAANRETTRPEDIAYCLLGIFGVNIPLLYGEGASRAFIRLQEEIMRRSDDQSIFAWRDPEAQSDALYGLLATSPALFADCGSTLFYESWEAMPPYGMTNRGLRIELPVQQDHENRSLNVAALNCPFPETDEDNSFLGIYLRKLSTGDQQYARAQANKLCYLSHTSRGSPRTIYKIKNKLAGALLLRHEPTDSRICVMFGSMADHNFGFRVIDTDVSCFQKDEKNLSDLQQQFTSPVPPGKWIRLKQVQVCILTTVHIFNGGKYFVIQPEIAERNLEDADGEAEDSDITDSERETVTMKRGESYISQAARPSPNRRTRPSRSNTYRVPLSETRPAARDRNGERAEMAAGITVAVAQAVVGFTGSFVN